VQNNYIKDLLNLKEVNIKKINNLKDKVEFYIELPTSEQTCPHCGAKTTKIHDYYSHTIKDIPLQFKPTYLIYNKRRYECKCCGKKFYETNSIVSKFKRRTNRLTGYVVNELRNLTSQSDVSKRSNISTSIISKMLPYLAVSTSKLPRVLCIDEFKGNTGNYKYQVALIDGETHDVVDILECRHKHSLCDYFKRFPKEQLNNVKYFVTDLWETYKDIAFTYFRKAKIVADHFHWARYACNALDKIRIEVQSNLPKNERKYFKHSRGLLLSRKCNIKEESYDELEYMLINYSENLRIAYKEKEDLLDILHSNQESNIKINRFKEWVNRNLKSDIPQLYECAKTYYHWYTEIKNSLEVPYSNGATEGFNNKIKVLKRVSFGMRNFKNFKARIM
jgi:transposase